MSKKGKSDLMLFITAFIWGSGFIAQSAGADVVGPFTFTSIRYGLAVLTLLPVIWLLDRGKKARANGFVTYNDDDVDTGYFKHGERKTLIAGGLLTGIVLFASTTLQQYAIAYTTAAKSGFITTLYVIIVPIMGILLHKKVRPVLWISVILGICGLYLLAIEPDTFTLGKGEFLTLICSFGFSCHIMIIDYFSPKVDCVKLSCIQFLTTSVLAFIIMIPTEQIVLSELHDALFSMVYAGVFSSAIAYTLQIIGQKDADPTVASLILSLESVFAAICGVIFLQEYLNLREITGCAIVFAAILIAQMPSPKELKAKFIRKKQ